MHADRVIARFAADQHGMVARRQLLDAGVTPQTITRRIAEGLLVVQHPGVYRVGSWPPTHDGAARAALLWGGAGAIVSHRSAAWVWGVGEPSTFVELTLARSTAAPAGLLVRRSSATWGVTRRRGLVVTDPYRLLVELGAAVEADDVTRGLDELVHRRLAAPARLRQALARHGGRGVRGSAALATILERRSVGEALTDSELEVRFLALLRGGGLPEPVVHHRIRAGPRTMVVDVAFVIERVAVELDGFAAHGGRRAFERDRERDRLLAAAGWRVLRFTWRDVVERPADVMVQLGRVLGRAA